MTSPTADPRPDWLRHVLNVLNALWAFSWPFVCLLAAALVGLAVAVAIRSTTQPLLLGLVDLMTGVDGGVRSWWNWWASLIGSSYSMTTSGLDKSKLDAVDLGFGVIGGSVLLATVKDTISAVAKVVQSWLTVPGKDLFDAAVAVCLSFIALGLSVYGLANLKQQPTQAQAQLADSGTQQTRSFHQQVWFLKSSEIAIMPIFFTNAKLNSTYWEAPYVSERPKTIPREATIWDEGVGAAGSEPQIRAFLSALLSCASRARPSLPIELTILGFASSREFRDKSEREHPQSDNLNLRAAYDRADSVYRLLLTLAKGAPLKITPPIEYRQLSDMHDARLTVDRPGSQELIDQEALGRRVDIVITQAPGCSGVSQLAGS